MAFESIKFPPERKPEVKKVEEINKKEPKVEKIKEIEKKPPEVKKIKKIEEEREKRES
jgi:hypothetical protein